MTLLTEELRSRIGVETEWSPPVAVDRASVFRYAEAVGLDTFPFRAGLAGDGVGVEVPPTYICRFHYLLPELELPLPAQARQRLLAEKKVNFGATIRIGDFVQGRSRVADIRQKTGSKLGQMLMIHFENEYRNQSQVEVARAELISIRYGNQHQ